MRSNSGLVTTSLTSKQAKSLNCKVHRAAQPEENSEPVEIACCLTVANQSYILLAFLAGLLYYHFDVKLKDSYLNAGAAGSAAARRRLHYGATQEPAGPVQSIWALLLIL